MASAAVATSSSAATTTKHIHIYAEDMADDMSKTAIDVSQEAFQLTITKGQVRDTSR